MYDIMVIGGGPAGLTAALYARRANKSVLVIEKATFGGQITYSPKVENIPGFISLTGNELADKLDEQVLEQGAEVEAAEVEKVEVEGNIKKVTTDCGDVFEGKSLIIATGARHRLLGLPNEESYIGEGISFCAVCDGAFYEDKTVAVIGGGNSALQEALLLSDLAKKVYVVQNLDFLTGEEKLSEQLSERDNIEVILGTVVKELHGEGELTGITVTEEKTGKDTLLEVDGMFIAIGLVPQNEIFTEVITLDDRGYAEAGEDCITSALGIFAAGDCRKKRIRQVTTAAADGAIAALAACDYVDNMR